MCGQLLDHDWVQYGASCGHVVHGTHHLVHGAQRVLQQVGLALGVVFEKLSDVVGVVIGRQQDDTDIGLLLPYLLCRYDAVHPGHLHVHDYDFRLEDGDHMYGLLTITKRTD